MNFAIRLSMENRWEERWRESLYMNERWAQVKLNLDIKILMKRKYNISAKISQNVCLASVFFYFFIEHVLRLFCEL